MSFGASFDGAQFSSVPGQLNMHGGAGNKEVSEVTGSSLQVHPPSSPPSVGVQTVSTKASGSSKTGLSAPIFVTGTTIQATTANQEGAVGGGGAGGAKDSSEAQNQELGGREAMEGAESMSSLPMSVPEGTR